MNYFTEVKDQYISPYFNELYQLKRHLIKQDFIKWRQNTFGLFKPYKDAKDFSFSLALPFIAPVALGIFAVVASIAATLTAVIAIGSLAIAGAAAVLKQQDIKNTSFQFASMASIWAGILAATVVLGPLLALLSFPATLISLATRSITTISHLSETEEKHKGPALS